MKFKNGNETITTYCETVQKELIAQGYEVIDEEPKETIIEEYTVKKKPLK